MNEKFPIPQAERLIGGENLKPEEVRDLLGKVPVDEKGNIISNTREILKKVFQEVAPRTIENLELPKSEEDIKIITLVIKSVKSFATQLGRKKFIKLPMENIHFLKPGGVKEYTEGRLDVGSHSTILGEVLVDRRDDLETTITTFHELWHTLASHLAIQVTSKGEVDRYRSGFNAKSRSGEEEWFLRIDEALTGLMTKKFVEEILVRDPELGTTIKEKLSKGEEIDTTREGEVEMLNNLIDKIYERNSGEFQSREEIISIFLKSQVTGRLLPTARLIEKTFGRGTFRRLGEITQE